MTDRERYKWTQKSPQDQLVIINSSLRDYHTMLIDALKFHYPDEYAVTSKIEQLDKLIEQLTVLQSHIYLGAWRE